MSAIKKAVKKVFKFVKKHWKKIVLVAAVVFTAGIATVGMAGFSSAMATAGGGIGGFLSAAGSTLVAGVTSIGGTLGIGNGANLAAFGGTGSATLGTGALAQSLGIAAPGASSTAGYLASGAGQAATASAATTATANAARYGVTLPQYGAAAANVAPVGTGTVLAPTAVASSAMAPVASSAVAGVAGSAAPVASRGFGGFLMSPIGGALVSGGLNAVSSYMAAKAQEEEEPQAAWGVDLQGNNSLNPSQVAIQPQQAYSSESWRRNAPARVA